MKNIDSHRLLRYHFLFFNSSSNFLPIRGSTVNFMSNQKRQYLLYIRAYTLGCSSRQFHIFQFHPLNEKKCICHAIFQDTFSINETLCEYSCRKGNGNNISFCVFTQRRIHEVYYEGSKSQHYCMIY